MQRGAATNCEGEDRSALCSSASEKRQRVFGIRTACRTYNQLSTCSYQTVLHYKTLLKAFPWVSLVLLGIAFVAIQSGEEPDMSWGWLICFAVACTWCIKVSLIAHEVGHLLFCRLSGGTATHMILGTESELFRLKIGGVWCHVHKNISRGFVQMGYRKSDFLRTRYGVAVLGGIAVNAALALATILYTGTAIPVFFATSEEQFRMSGIFLYANYSLIVTALLPFSIPIGKGRRKARRPTDGKQLLKLPFMKEHELQLLLITPVLAEVGELAEEKKYREALSVSAPMLDIYPGNQLLKRTIAALHILMLELDAAIAILSTVECGNNPEIAAAVQNELAWIYLLSEKAGALDLADAHSRRAVEILCTENIADTRGAILIERGEIKEGLSLLLELVDFSNPGKLSAAMYAGYGLFLLGDIREAEQYLSHVEANIGKLNPDTLLLFERIKRRTGAEEHSATI